jgi:hypothetical protein
MIYRPALGLRKKFAKFRQLLFPSKIILFESSKFTMKLSSYLTISGMSLLGHPEITEIYPRTIAYLRTKSPRLRIFQEQRCTSPKPKPGAPPGRSWKKFGPSPDAGATNLD